MSKASFLIAYACLSRGANLIIEDLIIAPERAGFIEALKKMGAKIVINNKRVRHCEIIGDVNIQYNGKLKNTYFSSHEVRNMIDEIPILSVVGALSKGVMEIEGISELRIKESDRVSAIIENLKSMGCNVRKHSNKIIIKGRNYLYNTSIKTFSDHRIAMAFYIASLFSKRIANFDNMKCIEISFPDFFDKINEITI